MEYRLKIAEFVKNDSRVSSSSIRNGSLMRPKHLKVANNG